MIILHTAVFILLLLLITVFLIINKALYLQRQPLPCPFCCFPFLCSPFDCFTPTFHPQALTPPHHHPSHGISPTDKIGEGSTSAVYRCFYRGVLCAFKRPKYPPLPPPPPTLCSPRLTYAHGDVMG